MEGEKVEVGKGVVKEGGGGGEKGRWRWGEGMEEGIMEEGTVEEGTVEEEMVEEGTVEEGVTEGFNNILSMMTFVCWVCV